MSKAKWIIVFLLAVSVAVPSYAVELTLGGFPSFFRIRPQFYKNATFFGALSNDEARLLRINDADDKITFVDSRLRLTPQLVLSDAVTIRAQVDVADNNIWGGLNSTLERDVVFSSLTPTDRFRGALLTNSQNVLFSGLGFFGAPFHTSPTDSVQYFNVRMLHVDIVLPDNLGFIRAGRQPFDWGLGILANGGWDPLSDLGFVLDRFLYLKSWPLYKGSFTFVFVSDRLRQGNTLINGQGDGYDGGAVALIYNQGPLTVGGYVFPYIHQTNFAGTDANLDRFTLYSGLIDYKTDFFRFVAEIQGAQGKITGAHSLGFASNEIKIKGSNIITAGRIEVYPGFPVKLFAGEFGLAVGDKINSAADGGDFQGNVLAFSAAYNIDNLLFKHIIPTIYGLENSVINAYYARAWTTVKLLDHVTFTPQVLFAWNDRRQALLPPNFFGTGESNQVRRFLGSELEGTLSVEVVPGVNFDFIGGVVIAGNGLKDLYRQKAASEFDTLAPAGTPAILPGDTSPPKAPFTFQGRLLVYIDQFFKK